MLEDPKVLDRHRSIPREAHERHTDGDPVGKRRVRVLRSLRVAQPRRWA